MKTAVAFFSLFLSPIAMLAQGLQLDVVEGDGAIHLLRSPRTTQPIVRVSNSAGIPVAGAAVTFVLPKQGPGAQFQGSSLLTVITREDGVAAARGMQPNSQAGAWEIQVTASLRGETARIVLTQVNAAPTQPQTSIQTWRKKMLIGIAAGAAVAGLAITAGGSAPAASAGAITAPPPGSVPIVVTPGTSAISGP